MRQLTIELPHPLDQQVEAIGLSNQQLGRVMTYLLEMYLKIEQSQAFIEIEGLQDNHQAENGQYNGSGSHQQQLNGASATDITASHDPPNIDQEEAAYKQMHSELLEDLAGEYVAIYGKELIDHDTDRIALYERIDREHPDDFVLIRPVEKKLEREFYFRSTRFLERI